MITALGDVVDLTEAEWVCDWPTTRDCGCSEPRINPYTRDRMECESAAGCDCSCDCHQTETYDGTFDGPIPVAVLVQDDIIDFPTRSKETS